MGAIYRCVNTVNGKTYVGQTTKSGWKERYKIVESQIKYFKKTGKKLRPFEAAIAKYGLEKLQFRDLMTNVPDESLDALECFFIRHFDSMLGAGGYNADTGGNTNKKASEATRVKQREVQGTKKRWYHAAHGEHFVSTGDLSRMFPEQDLRLNTLQFVQRGAYSQYKGWKCLDVPPRGHTKKRRVNVWEHPEFGQFIGTNGQLRRHFPLQDLRITKLAKLMNGLRHRHRGWAFVRPAEGAEFEQARLAA